MTPRVLLATSVLALLPFTAYSEEPPPQVAAPAIHIGDSWTFRYIDVWKGTPSGLTRQEVAAVTDDEVVVNATRLADGRLTRLRLSREMNPLYRGTMRFSPSYPRYAFPLEPGKTWERDITGDNPSLGKTWRYQVKGKVVGWEHIKVEAGEFDALKVELEAYYQGMEVIGQGGSGKLKETVWYAPAVKAFVKLDYQDTDWRNKIYNRDSWELTAYNLK